MDNRKNTILLTVIAVATLLVAVVGATFAYFTAQGGVTQTGNINVQTEAAASSSFNVDETLSLLVNMDNFNQTSGADVVRDMNGTATFTAGTGDGAQTEFCYTVTLAWTEASPSDFVYTDGGSNTEPELTLTVTKNTAGNDGIYSGTPTTIWDSVDITTSTLRQQRLNIPDPGNSDSTVHKLTAAAGEKASAQYEVELTYEYYDRNQTANAGKVLTGTLTFEQATCTEVP